MQHALWPRVVVALLFVLISAAALAPAANAHDRCLNKYDSADILRGVACIKDFHNDLSGANPGCGHAYAVSNWYGMNICVEQPIGCREWVGI